MVTPIFNVKKGSGKPIQHMINFCCVQKLFRLYFVYVKANSKGLSAKKYFFFFFRENAMPAICFQIEA